MPDFDVNGAGPKVGNIDTLAAEITHLGATSQLRLYQSSFVPTPDSVEADFVAAEATFTGYAPVVLTYSPAGLEADGKAVSFSNDATYQATDGVTPNTIGGMWLARQTAAGPPAVYAPIAYYPFPVPIAMAAALATMRAVLRLLVPGFPGDANVSY